MLQVLSAGEWVQTVVVAARWFGGIKLGRGGLVRAYQRTCQLALEHAVPGTLARVLSLSLQISYSAYDRLERYLAEYAIWWEAGFSSTVTIRLRATPGQWTALSALLDQHAFSDWRLAEQSSMESILPVTALPDE